MIIYDEDTDVKWVDKEKERKPALFLDRSDKIRTYDQRSRKRSKERRFGHPAVQILTKADLAITRIQFYCIIHPMGVLLFCEVMSNECA